MIVVTDLDGTLLDAATYDWEPAREALDALRARRVPVVFCTSKTRAETEYWQAVTGVNDPFIFESGGGISVGGRTLELGVPYDALLVRFRRLKELANGAIVGFSDMTDEDLSRDSGVSPEQAAMARRREFDEPFRFLRDETELLSVVKTSAEAWGLRVTRGGRYWHLHGPTDKGLALKRLLAHDPRPRSVGLGDSAQDLPMLLEVDVPVAIARPDGTHDPDLVAGIPTLRRTREPGPAGWSLAILEWLRNPPTPDRSTAAVPPPAPG